MGKIACITDKVGRIQHQRMVMLSKDLGNCDVFTLGDRKRINWKLYSLVYYSNYSIVKRVPCKNRKICSITSHKSLDNKKETIKLLKGFQAVSVNNRYLEKEFLPYVKNLYYTPNGVDSVFFHPIQNDSTDKLRIGWVGNKDRKTKNFPILRQLKNMNFESVELKLVASKKSSKSLPKNQPQMRDFYRGLDFFLVTSSTEGTPNPALEALSCGIPIITTRVGNMEEIVRDGYNGFFVPPKSSAFAKIINRITDMQPEEISRLSANARKSIVECEWDWKFKKISWLKMFEDFRNG